MINNKEEYKRSKRIEEFAIDILERKPCVCMDINDARALAENLYRLGYTKKLGFDCDRLPQYNSYM